MENLKRFNLVTKSETFGFHALMEENKDGDFVKFSDIKDILKTPTNNKRVDICEHYNEGKRCTCEPKKGKWAGIPFRCSSIPCSQPSPV